MDIRRVTSQRTVVAVLAALCLAGCTDAEGDDETEPPPTEASDVEGKPNVEVPEDATPPDTLQVEDLSEGDGEEIVEGSLVTLHFVGVRWSDGAEFASSWDRGQPVSYTHGQGRWVEGWEQGLQGMRAGGRRQLLVPPEFGYGERGAPRVPAGETLVFIVDLLEVE